MRANHFTKPVFIFFLILPSGISGGFATVALPYLLSNNGFPVAQTAGIVAIGVSANLWRFLWGPVVDISLSLRRWYFISLTASLAALLLLCLTPFTVNGATLLTAVVFVSQVACTFLLLPISGIMAKRIKDSDKGKASGYYQAGSLAGAGLGGGAGLWLASHYNVVVTGIALSAASLACAMVILLIKDVAADKNKSMLIEIKDIGNGIITMLKIPAAVFVILLILTPIGSGASANLWSAIANDWQADADTVALVTGILSGLVSAAGCIAGGYIADRWGIWKSYLGSGTVCVAVALVMALLPMQPAVYIGGVLAYAFSMGMIYAAFTAVLLYAIGKTHAATKFSLLASLGNIPVVYMTAFNGWMHDKFDSKLMLIAEALAGLLFVIVFLVALKRMLFKKLIPVVIE